MIPLNAFSALFRQPLRLTPQGSDNSQLGTKGAGSSGRSGARM